MGFACIRHGDIGRSAAGSVYQLKPFLMRRSFALLPTPVKLWEQRWRAKPGGETLDPRFIDDLAQKLSDALPGGLRSLQQDLEGNFKAVLRTALGKLDLVTREEFEVQSAVLARTREMLKSFEARIADMEAKAGAGTTRKRTAARKKATRKKTGKKTSS